MTNTDFHSDDNKNLRECITVLERHCNTVVLVFNEYGIGYKTISDEVDYKAIEDSLEGLNSFQKMVLSELY